VQDSTGFLLFKATPAERIRRKVSKPAKSLNKKERAMNKQTPLSLSYFIFY
jgi:hypothetical protein